MKYQLKRITGNVKLTFEEYSTVITQIEACLNSRPLVALSCNDDGIEALTPGHFLIGRPLESLQDPSFFLSYSFTSMLLALVSKPDQTFLAKVVSRVSV